MRHSMDIGRRAGTVVALVVWAAGSLLAGGCSRAPAKVRTPPPKAAGSVDWSKPMTVAGVAPGMSPQEVESAVGPPTTKRHNENPPLDPVDHWSYADRKRGDTVVWFQGRCAVVQGKVLKQEGHVVLRAGDTQETLFKALGDPDVTLKSHHQQWKRIPNCRLSISLRKERIKDFKMMWDGPRATSGRIE